MLCGGADGTDVEDGVLPAKVPQDSAMKIVCKRGVIRLLLVGVILWVVLILLATLFHVWSCHSSISFLSGIYALKLFWSLFDAFTFCFFYYYYWLISKTLYLNKTKLIAAPLNPKMKVFHPNLCPLFSYIYNGNLTEHFRNPLQSIVIKLEISGVFIMTLFQLKFNKNNQDDIFQI